MRNNLRWVARGLAILLITLTILFSLDVFDGTKWFLALIMHLVPTYILIILTIIAWRWEKWGGILFLLAAGVVALFFHSISLSIPVLVVGILFIIVKSKI